MPDNKAIYHADLTAPPTPPAPRVLLPVDNADISIREVRYNNKSLTRELFETILITVLIFLAVQAVVQNRRVEGSSMEPTLHGSVGNEEFLLIDKLSYMRWNQTPLANLFQNTATPPGYVMGAGPQRGDIVVLHPPVDSRDYIKRIVALEGETVQVKQYDGVYIDGVRIEEPYVKDTPDYNYGPYKVPADNVFVLGDNRRNSSDSHAWGALKTEEIVGKAWFSYWPRDDWGLLPHPSYAEFDQK